VLTINLTGKRALVTGAGRGVGRGIATTLAQAGATVVVNDIGARADDAVQEIRAAGGDARSSVFDVTDWGMVSDAVADMGRIDILVNNAGNSGTDTFNLVSFVETEPKDWDTFFRINLYGVMHCARAALPGMIEEGWGRIVTIVSESARTGEPKLAAYSAAKAGAAGFGRSLAKEVGRHGITVNSIALGTIATPGVGNPETIEKLLRNYAIRRRGEPGDAAGFVAFLASDYASWITGQTIPVNGGYSMAQ
jgi:NAD(P)-dependent dehydrogenase (short-subunit alcohol dehydrogenase family)